MKKESLHGLLDKIKAKSPSLCLALMSGWLCSLLIFMLGVTPDFSEVPAFADSVSLPLFLLLTVLISALLFAADLLVGGRVLILFFPVIFIVYGSVSVASLKTGDDGRTYSALLFCLLAAGVIAICVCCMKRIGLSLPVGDISSRVSFIIITVAFVLISALFIWLLWTRKELLCSPCFDMGIFAQLYDGMKETLLPITTCERGYELSHFAVHFSPALYLLLPFCYIFEVTDVLVFAQVLLVFSGVFPLWLICKRVGLSNKASAALSLLMLLYPAMSSGGFYDFHENAFLTPFVLWTLYFIHAERYIPAFIFALGILSVKEDAALYVIFIALYLVFSRKKYWQGAAMLAMAVGYFLMASHILLSGDQGMMLGSRFFNVIGYDGSFTDLIRVLIVNPALYAVESFTADKMLYFFNMLIPLAFLPFMTKKPSRWLLIAPLFVMNLVSDYPYQYNIGFQYSFGSGALLFYLSALNLADITKGCYTPTVTDGGEATEAAAEDTFTSFRRHSATALVVFALCSSVLLLSARMPTVSSYARAYATSYGDVAKAKEVMDTIDKNRSIAATSMYLTYLYEADELYHLNSSTGQVLDEDGSIKLFTDVVVIDLRGYSSDAEYARAWTFRYQQEGYTVTHHIDNVITVLERMETAQ